MKKRIQRGGFFFGPLFSMLTNSMKGGGVVKKNNKKNTGKKTIQEKKNYIKYKK